MLGLLTGRKLTGRERRKAPRKPLGTVGQLVVCPASSRTAPLEVHVNDYSVTGIGIIHNEPLPLGQKYVIKEQNVARQGSVLFTVVRCDRIDFPLGEIAHRHTHPGPGIRYLLHGELEIETEGRAAFYGPGGAWFETGPYPVVARASSHVETSFVRVLVLPAEWAGKRTIRYVDAVDESTPKQSASVYLEHPISIPL